MRAEEWDKQRAKIIFAKDSANHAKYFLIPEDTQKGYFQLLIFHIIGEHFGLYWHAFYAMAGIYKTTW